MYPRWKAALAALLTTVALTLPVHGATVEMGGERLDPTQGWVEEGVSHITLRSYAARTGRTLAWDGTYARLTGGGLELCARPGDLYITANGRPLYVADGVRAVEGVLTLPLGVVARAAGDQLTWDSTAATARLIPSAAPAPQASYDQEDLYWLARIISAESRGEPLLGQMAVGNVVLNRVADSQFPNTVKGVVFDRKNGVQFTPVSNGTVYQEPTPQSVLAAKLCLEGARVVEDCLYFYNPDLATSTWIRNNRSYYTTIGCHRFYR